MSQTEKGFANDFNKTIRDQYIGGLFFTFIIFSAVTLIQSFPFNLANIKCMQSGGTCQYREVRTLVPQMSISTMLGVATLIITMLLALFVHYQTALKESEHLYKKAEAKYNNFSKISVHELSQEILPLYSHIRLTGQTLTYLLIFFVTVLGFYAITPFVPIFWAHKKNIFEIIQELSNSPILTLESFYDDLKTFWNLIDSNPLNPVYPLIFLFAISTLAINFAAYQVGHLHPLEGLEKNVSTILRSSIYSNLSEEFDYSDKTVIQAEKVNSSISEQIKSHSYISKWKKFKIFLGPIILTSCISCLSVASIFPQLLSFETWRAFFIISALLTSSWLLQLIFWSRAVVQIYLRFHLKKPVVSFPFLILVVFIPIFTFVFYYPLSLTSAEAEKLIIVHAISVIASIAVTLTWVRKVGKQIVSKLVFIESAEGLGEGHTGSASGDEGCATQDSSTDLTAEENSTVSSVCDRIFAVGSKFRDCIYKALGVNYYIHVLFRELLK